MSVYNMTSSIATNTDKNSMQHLAICEQGRFAGTNTRVLAWIRENIGSKNLLGLKLKQEEMVPG